jgi:hypothetical protein
MRPSEQVYVVLQRDCGDYKEVSKKLRKPKYHQKRELV